VHLSVKENLLQLVNPIAIDHLDEANVLASDMFLDEVRNDIYNAQNMGIRGVPFFLINNTHAISGAQEDTVFEETLSNALNN
jgi:predicted DsbA family dithiol-disulfide isomerase